MRVSESKCKLQLFLYVLVKVFEKIGVRGKEKLFSKSFPSPAYSLPKTLLKQLPLSKFCTICCKQLRNLSFCGIIE